MRTPFYLIAATALLVIGCRPPVDESGEPEATLVLVEKFAVPLGQFTTSSDVLVATDPGYDLTTARIAGLGAIVTGCREGTWMATVVRKRFQNDGWAIPSELLVFHDSLEDWSAVQWTEVPKGLGADTGQVGIWEMNRFHDDSLVPKDIKWTFGTKERPEPAIPEDLWYSWCCEMTNGENGASLMPHGVVSRSGFGDGGYPVFVGKDAQGRIVALLVRFIDDHGRG